MHRWWIAPLGLGLVLTTAGCGETQGQRATTGALGGIAFGAAVGGPIGALVGGAAGAGVGSQRPAEDKIVNTGSQKAEAAVNNAMGNLNNTMASAGSSAPAGAAANAPPRSAAAAPTRQGLRSAQQKLTQLGLYKGPIDGKYGPQTAAALTDFQAENGLPRSGHLTRTTEQRLNEVAQAPNNQPNGAPNPQTSAVPPGGNANPANTPQNNTNNTTSTGGSTGESNGSQPANTNNTNSGPNDSGSNAAPNAPGH